LDVRAFGKDGIEMREHCKHRPVPRGLRGGPATNAHHIALGIRLNIGEAGRAQHLEERRRTRRFLEWWRRNFPSA
jgi:hypothetical protein